MVIYYRFYSITISIRFGLLTSLAQTTPALNHIKREGATTVSCLVLFLVRFTVLDSFSIWNSFCSRSFLFWTLLDKSFDISSFAGIDLLFSSRSRPLLFPLASSPPSRRSNVCSIFSLAPSSLLLRSLSFLTLLIQSHHRSPPRRITLLSLPHPSPILCVLQCASGTLCPTPSWRVLFCPPQVLPSSRIPSSLGLFLHCT